MYLKEIILPRLLIFISLVAFSKVSIVQGATLRPPLPPTKVVALAALGEDVSEDRLRYYSFRDEDKSNGPSRPPAGWEPGHSSGDPFEVPSLSVIAEMMRRRDSEREGGGPRPSDGGKTGWGWTEPETTPRPPQPPPTEGWGWKPETTTWAPPPPPPTRGWGWKPETTTWAPLPPPPPTEGWGWKPETTTKGWGWGDKDEKPYNYGIGSYAVVDKKAEAPNRFWHYGKEESTGSGWGTVTTTTTTTTTTPKYDPHYLSSDEAKYKPIKYPIGWADSTTAKPTSSWAVGSGKWTDFINSNKGQGQGSSYPVSSGSQVPYPGGPKPAHYPFYPPQPSDHETQGSGWYPPTTPAPRPPKEPEGGWGWPKPEPPTRPPPPPPTQGWGWSSGESKPEIPQSPGPFEYKQGKDDLTKNIFPDTYERSDYPPGVQPDRNSFEIDDFPSEPNHYRLVPYTPSPEERYKLSRNPPRDSPGVGVTSAPPPPPPSSYYGGGGGGSGGGYKGNYQTGGGGGGGNRDNDSREKWFLNNFQRGKTSTSTPPTTARPPPPPPPTRGSTRPTTTPPSGGKDTNSGKTGSSSGPNSVTEKTTPKPSGPRKTRYDEHGFKYIPYDHPLAKRIANNQRDIYDNTDYTNDGEALRRESDILGSESHIRLWTAEDPNKGVGVEDFGPNGPPPFFTREALMERSKGDTLVSVGTTTKAPCPSGEFFSKKSKKCKKSKTSSTTQSPSAAGVTKTPIPTTTAPIKK